MGEESKGDLDCDDQLEAYDLAECNSPDDEEESTRTSTEIRSDFGATGCGHQSCTLGTLGLSVHA